MELVAGRMLGPPRPDGALVARSGRGSWLGRERHKGVSEAGGPTHNSRERLLQIRQQVVHVLHAAR